MKTLREMMDLVESIQSTDKIDRAILDLLVAGVPAEKIAIKLDIPVDWVLEFQDNYEAPEVVPSDVRLTPSNLSGMNEEELEETEDPLKKIDELFKDSK